MSQAIDSIALNAAIGQLVVGENKPVQAAQVVINCCRRLVVGKMFRIGAYAVGTNGRNTIQISISPGKVFELSYDPEKHAPKSLHSKELAGFSIRGYGLWWSKKRELVHMWE